jgi:hypothetical protein
MEAQSDHNAEGARKRRLNGLIPTLAPNFQAVENKLVAEATGGKSSGRDGIAVISSLKTGRESFLTEG